MVVKWGNGDKEVVMPWQLNYFEVCGLLIYILFNYYFFKRTDIINNMISMSQTFFFNKF